MGSFERVHVGIQLANDSFRVLRQQPSLLVFPLCSGALGLAFLWTLSGGPLSVLLEGAEGTLIWILLLYSGTTLLASVFNAALVYNAREVFHGQNPPLRAGLAAAARRFPTLLAYSIVAGIVSLVVHLLQSSDSSAGDVAGAGLSLAWSVGTYFIIPVIVFEDAGALTMIDRSKAVFSSKWGEAFGTGFGVRTIVIMLAILGVILVGLLVLLLDAVFGHIDGASLLFVPVLLLTYLLGTALGAVAKTALYVYATEDEHPAPFSDVDFSHTH